MDRNLAEIIREDIGRLCRVSGTKQFLTEQLLEGERRNVAILFLDIEGFSSLSEKLDHETVHLIIDGVMRALGRVVELHGGYVDKFEGDLIMALFGARRSAEHDAVRAVTCGLRMLETLYEANGVLAGAGIELEARVGISSGNVTVAPDPLGHMTAMGEEVNLARRMESAAAPGTILTTSIVHEESCSHFNWENLGSIEVKGFSRPIETYRPLEAIADPGERFRWTSEGVAAFTGRKSEIEKLVGYFGEYLTKYHESTEDYSGNHTLLVIEGSAGSGKSRLIHEFLSGYKQLGEARVLKGHTAFFAQPPYRLWTSVLQNLFGFSRTAEISAEDLESSVCQLLGTRSLSKRLKRGMPFLGTLLPNCANDIRLQEMTDEVLCSETVSAIGSLLDALAHRNPLILVMEDVHNIDEASFAVLESILAGVHCGKPVMVVIVRRSESSDGQNISTVTETASEFHDLILGEMTDADLANMIENRLKDVTPQVRLFLLERSQGNPYFLEEMIKDLIEAGAISKEKGMFDFITDTSNIHVPPSLDGLLQSRVDRLPLNLKLSLQCASVLGSEFSLDLYASMVMRLDIESDPEISLKELEQRGFLVLVNEKGDTAYRFESLLMKDAVYALLLHYNRQLLHRIAAEAIIGDEFYSPEGRAPALAIHLHRGGETARAVKWGMKALLSSARSSENYRVLEWTLRLMQWIDSIENDSEYSEDMLEILRNRQLALLNLGKIDESIEILDRINRIARKNVDDRIRISALNSTARFHIIRSEINKANELLSRAEDLNRDRYPEEKALTLFLQGLSKRKEGMNVQAEELYRKAVPIAESVGNKSLLGSIMGNLGIIARILGNAEDAMRIYKEALTIHREIGNRADEIIVLYNIANIYSNRGDLVEGEKTYLQIVSISEETGNLRILGSALGSLGTVYYELGDLEKGLEYLTRAEKISMRTGDLRNLAWHITNKAEIYIEAENWGMARSNLVKSMELAEQCDYRLMTAYNKSLLARVLLVEGDSREAMETAEEGLRVQREIGNLFDLAIAVISMGMVEADIGHLEKAMDSYSEARDIISSQGIADNVFTGLRHFRAVLIESGIDKGDLALPAGWKYK